MDSITVKTSVANSVPAVLRGGPASLPQVSRSQLVDPFVDKIKILHYGGYEHFERVRALEENQSSQEIIFRWTMRTEIAE